PPTSLPEMMALLGCFRLYVGANTAALHMAWMQGVPSVVLAGGRPWRTDRPLEPVPSVMLSAGGIEPDRKLRGEEAQRAVEGIEVDDVVAAARRLLQ
ncbi:MAG: glycosyltransferase family 9 protein, partial [Candidatus Binatia bacterium]